MLATLSTSLARNRRQKRLILSCRCSQLEIAAIAVRVAESQDASLIITLDLTRPLTVAPAFLVAATLLLARQSTVPVVVEAFVEPEEQTMLDVLTEGGLAIAPRIESLQAHLVEPTLAIAAKLTVAFGGELVICATTQGLEAKLADLVHTHDAQAVRIRGHHPSRQAVVPHEIQTLCKDLHIPVIAEEIDLNPAELKKLSKSGVSGVTIGNVLEEAFTAGLRTGLRDRSLSEPARYYKTANRAVEETLINHFHYLKH